MAYRKMCENMCTFYFRDREETFDGESFKTFTSHNDLFEYAESSWCEFIYIMKAGVWYVDQMEGAGLELLSEALETITQYIGQVLVAISTTTCIILHID